MDIEQEALGDGFRIVLIGLRIDRASNRAALRALRFDGGVRREACEREGPLDDPGSGLAACVRRLAAHVARPPHLFAAWGAGWHAGVAACVEAGLLRPLRVLPLRRTAIALAGGLRPGAGLDALRRDYGLTGAADDSPLPPVCEDLLWALLHRAAQRGLSWEELLGAAESARSRAPFERYAFDEATLARWPPVPAVYLLFGEGSRLLYVGKTGNLARRMGEHFRPAAAPAAREARLREATRDLRYEPVGSELEALLREQALIDEWRPEANRQRRVAEGASRYAFPPFPVAVICPSARRRRAELFILGEGCRAVQMRLDPARPPRQLLARWVRHFVHGARRPAATATVTDWGTAGNELACRHFARCRDGLQWVELAGGADPSVLASRVLGLVRVVAVRRPDAGEFR